MDRESGELPTDPPPRYPYYITDDNALRQGCVGFLYVDLFSPNASNADVFVASVNQRTRLVNPASLTETVARHARTARVHPEDPRTRPRDRTQTRANANTRVRLSTLAPRVPRCDWNDVKERNAAAQLMREGSPVLLKNTGVAGRGRGRGESRGCLVLFVFNHVFYRGWRIAAHVWFGGHVFPSPLPPIPKTKKYSDEK